MDMEFNRLEKLDEIQSERFYKNYIRIIFELSKQ